MILFQQQRMETPRKSENAWKGEKSFTEKVKETVMDTYQDVSITLDF